MIIAITTAREMTECYIGMVLLFIAAAAFIVTMFISLGIEIYNKEIRSKKIIRKRPCEKCVWYDDGNCMNTTDGYAPIYFKLYPHKECEVWMEKIDGME